MVIQESMKDESRVEQGHLLSNHDHVPSIASPKGDADPSWLTPKDAWTEMIWSAPNIGVLQLIRMIKTLPGQPPQTRTADNGYFQRSVVASGSPFTCADKDLCK